MSVEMKQKAGANVTPKDDALLYEFLIADSGVVEGCVVSAIGGTQMKITSGRGVILGRVFVIEAETIQATLPATTETQNGRLLVRINGTTQEIAMVTQAAASLPALQKEDINRGGTLYELELATYKISKTVITDLQVTAHTIEPHPKNTLLHVTKALQDAWNAAVQDVKALLNGSKKAHTAANAEAVPWDGITGRPDTFAPSTHNHDDRYYTETEMNTKLAGKANSSHTHTSIRMYNSDWSGTDGSITPVYANANKDYVNLSAGNDAGNKWPHVSCQRINGHVLNMSLSGTTLSITW